MWWQSRSGRSCQPVHEGAHEDGRWGVMLVVLVHPMGREACPTAQPWGALAGREEVGRGPAPMGTWPHCSPSLCPTARHSLKGGPVPSDGCKCHSRQPCQADKPCCALPAPRLLSPAVSLGASPAPHSASQHGAARHCAPQDARRLRGRASGCLRTPRTPGQRGSRWRWPPPHRRCQT